MKDKATKLANYLKDQGINLTRSQALEAIARVEGFKDWNTAAAANAGNKVKEDPRDEKRREDHRAWLAQNESLIEVNLRLSFNKYGTPIVFVDVKRDTEKRRDLSIVQPPMVYVDAIRQALADYEWAENPRDDLGDLPRCQ